MNKFFANMKKALAVAWRVFADGFWDFIAHCLAVILADIIKDYENEQRRQLQKRLRDPGNFALVYNRGMRLRARYDFLEEALRAANTMTGNNTGIPECIMLDDMVVISWTGFLGATRAAEEHYEKRKRAIEHEVDCFLKHEEKFDSLFPEEEGGRYKP